MWSLIKTLFNRFLRKKVTDKVTEIVEEKLTGWIADAADERDIIFVPPKPTKRTKLITSSADITDKFGPVESQGTLNSCVGHAVTSILEAGIGVKDLSRLFVYYNGRANEGRTSTDSGCGIRSAISGVAKKGAAAEVLWPYDPTKVLVMPSSAAYTDGLSIVSRISTYERVTSLDSMKGALTAGLPVVFGFKVYQHFRTETATTGMYSYPTTQSVIGTHAVVAVGFNDATGLVKCRNSFGSSWGQSGYFYMPYQWFGNFTTLVADAWVIRPKV